MRHGARLQLEAQGAGGVSQSSSEGLGTRETDGVSPHGVPRARGADDRGQEETRFSFSRV